SAARRSYAALFRLQFEIPFAIVHGSRSIARFAKKRAFPLASAFPLFRLPDTLVQRHEGTRRPAAKSDPSGLEETPQFELALFHRERWSQNSQESVPSLHKGLHLPFGQPIAFSKPGHRPR